MWDIGHVFMAMKIGFVRLPESIMSAVGPVGQGIIFLRCGIHQGIIYT